MEWLLDEERDDKRTREICKSATVAILSGLFFFELINSVRFCSAFFSRSGFLNYFTFATVVVSAQIVCVVEQIR